MLRPCPPITIAKAAVVRSSGRLGCNGTGLAAVAVRPRDWPGVALWAQDHSVCWYTSRALWCLPAVSPTQGPRSCAACTTAVGVAWVDWRVPAVHPVAKRATSWRARFPWRALTHSRRRGPQGRSAAPRRGGRRQLWCWERQLQLHWSCRALQLALHDDFCKLAPALFDCTHGDTIHTAQCRANLHSRLRAKRTWGHRRNRAVGGERHAAMRFLDVDRKPNPIDKPVLWRRRASPTSCCNCCCV